MKRTRIGSALLLLLALLGMLVLSACTPGDLGSEEIAFLRDGNLWTINPNGANAFEAVAQSTPVLGYGLSPNHQIFVFRTLDSSVQKSGAHLVIDPITGLTGDVPSSLNTVGIDGGTPIPIILSSPNLARSDAWWSPTGTRLLYREGASSTLDSPDLVTWVVSQNDQPVGIARKFLPNSFSIPSINADSSMAIGNSVQGVYTTTLAGTDLTFVQRGALPGHPLPASLERLLWQPAHQNPALLYAISEPSAGEQGLVGLVLREANGQIRLLADCACSQFSWSPDGNRVLYSTYEDYMVLNIQDGTSFHFATELNAVPYWSPDGRTLLLDGLHTLTLTRMDNQQTQVLLSDGSTPTETSHPLPGSTAFLHPVANSLWNGDGQRFVVMTRGRTQWLGQQLRSGNGLYMITLSARGEPQAAPALVDSNEHDTQPGWSYIDPNTSFLF